MIEFCNHLVLGSPERIALVDRRRSVSYDELDRRSAAIAHYLRRRGVGGGAFVAIWAGREVESITAMLGVMRAGAGYSLVDAKDTSTPTMGRLSDGTYAAVLTTRKRREDLRRLSIAAEIVEEAQEFEPGGDTLPSLGPSQPAYLLFTSGSTGKPKGVVVTHDNLHHYLGGIQERLRIAEPLNYAHVSTLAADLGNTGLFLALHTGGTLHLLDEETRTDPMAFWEYLREHRIDFLKLTPSHWSVLSPRGRTSPRIELAYLVLGGEALPVSMAEEILRAGQARCLVNHYGPTETTIGVTVNVMRDCGDLSRDAHRTVPIGTPFGETRLLVKTDEGRFVSRDAKGELFIGGPSVARGYLNDPQGTAARFVTGVDGATRFYRTGDLVHVDDDGCVEFLGRIDRQIKVNGYRIELEHVEAVIKQIPEVSGAFACAFGSTGAQRLAALVSTVQPGCVDAMKRQLQAMLPSYMVPSIIFACDELPVNGNGKIDAERARALIESCMHAAASRPTLIQASDREDPIISYILSTWEKHLGTPVISLDQEFADLGGDSITAIQVIGDLQDRGYRVTANAFEHAPTARALAERIRNQAEEVVPAVKPVLSNDGTLFSAAQRWFWAQRFAQPSHWNQALLLESQFPIEPEKLRVAASMLLARHPQLRTRYLESQGAPQKNTVLDEVECVEWSALPNGTDQEIERHLREVATAVQSRIELTGSVFRIHLLKSEDGRDLLLLVCHHLAVDAVSWRIIVSELVDYYGSKGSIWMTLAHASMPTLENWVDHLAAHREDLKRDLSFWNEMFARPMARLPRDKRGRNVEGASRTLWFALSRQGTEVIESRLPDLPMSSVVLGAFCHAIGQHYDVAEVDVELESQGRRTFDGVLDVSRTVGWFTSAFPLRLGIDRSDPAACMRSAETVVSSVPNLGIAYGEWKYAAELVEGARAVPSVCFNYLGRFRFPKSDVLSLSPACLPIGPVRGPENDRVHDLKVSARILEGQLVVDLSYSDELYDTDRLLSLCRIMLSTLEGRAVDASAARIVMEPFSSTGLLTYCPAQLITASDEPGNKFHRQILVTGATGFLGIHLVRRLLLSSSAQVSCVVRAAHGETAYQRLESAYRWYFDEPLAKHRHRISVVEGDLECERLGLAYAEFDELCRRVDCIYHLAADTRLFGDSKVIGARNERFLQSIIALASRGRSKELHYASTLAVSGRKRGSEEVAFSEDSLDIGQDHLNAYEAGKFRAELMMRDFVAGGGLGYVYRAGNVSGHSMSGRFQRNADANRIVQLLRGVVRVGKVPRRLSERITLTPVDAVIDAMVAIACSDTEPGVFHVDSGVSMPLTAVLDALRGFGVAIEPCEATTLKEMLERFGDRADPAIALAAFWAAREDRNVRYESKKTHELLRRLGIELRGVDESWLRRFVGDLVARKVLTEPGPIVPKASQVEARRGRSAELMESEE